jgi:hypothetical protein
MKAKSNSANGMQKYRLDHVRMFVLNVKNCGDRCFEVMTDNFQVLEIYTSKNCSQKTCNY